jgi:WD40 repeat protein
MPEITSPPRPELPGATAGLIRVFGDVRFHPDTELLALVFAADGTLWSIEEPGDLRQWNEAGQQLCHHYLSDLETVWAFGGDARLIASGNNDLSLWTVATGRLVETIGQPSWVTALALAPDSRSIATGHDNGLVCLWDVAGGRLLCRFAAHADAVSALAFSSDGSRLASAGEERQIAVWDVESGQRLGVLQGHKDRIQALAWQPAGELLVSAGWDGIARVWSARTFEPVLLLNNHTDRVTALAFSPEGRFLASADAECAIYLWDFTANCIRARLEGHSGEVTGLAFHRDGRHLASAGMDRMIQVWDLDRSQAARPTAARGPWEATESRPRGMCLSLSPDGSRLAVTQGSSLQVWDARTAESVARFEANSFLHGLACSHDGRLLAAGAADASIRIWDMGNGCGADKLEDERQRQPLHTLAFAHDSSLLAVASATGTEVWLWNVAEREPILIIPDALCGCAIESLAFHPHNQLLAVGGIDWLATSGSDGAVALWDLVQRCEVATFDGGSKMIAFHPSGRWLAAATLVKSICIWALDSQELAAELVGHDDTVSALAYSPDGNWLASGGDDQVICLWDAASGKRLASRQLDTKVKALVFSPDGRFLFTGNGNTTCYQLDVQQILPS